MPKLLIIGSVWPEKGSTAASTRIMQLIETFVQKSWRITFACAAQKGERALDLQSIGIDEVTIQLNHSSFDDFIAQLQPNRVLFDRFMVEEQFGWRVMQVCPDALRMIETSDLHCLREARHQLLKQAIKNRQQDFGKRLPMKTYWQEMVKLDICKRELASIFRSDLSLMISEYEVALLTQYFSVPEKILHFCPFMVKSEPQRRTLAYQQRQDFITIGNFRHAPNWDSVLWLKESIWPIIHKHLPQAKMHIYGAYMPPKAQALHNPKQGFYLHGWVEDAQQVMQQARLCLAPLRFGAGIKGKLLDAMLAGTPSITTEFGAESMSKGDWPGKVVTDAQGFAQAAMDLYRDQQQWQRAQQQGFDTLNTFFNQKQHQQKLINKIEKVKEKLQQYRQQNFIGAMLQHHQYQSSKYLSRWIELKNQV